MLVLSKATGCCTAREPLVKQEEGTSRPHRLSPGQVPGGQKPTSAYWEPHLQEVYGWRVLVTLTLHRSTVTT